MSEQEHEKSHAGNDATDEGLGISDDQLPEDLVPGEDNPLAEGLEDRETVEGLLDGGKTADEMESEESDGDSVGQDDSSA
ncbi:hypothetical protein [Nocardioides nanhaiensis]|uniref:Sugar ABC transporter ATPase n=1 Tax=Nocardioides nanhaiensis TaxID=1476871 RepID=A0ABP8WU54_9ACTN